MVGALAARADVPCVQRSVSRPFSGWGDNKDYFLAPGGDFEYNSRAGVDGTWSETSGLTTEKRVGPANRAWSNEPFRVTGPGSRSLFVSSGRSFMSPTFCVASDEESIRFAGRGPAGGTIVVRIVVRSSLGSEVVEHVVVSKGYWEVLNELPIPSIRDESGQQWVTITFGSGSGDWNIDTVMVDPWRTL
jgi:hypothetical protein